MGKVAHIKLEDFTFKYYRFLLENLKDRPQLSHLPKTLSGAEQQAPPLRKGTIF